MAEDLGYYGGKKLVDLGFLLLAGVFGVLAAMALIGGDLMALFALL